MAYPWFHLVALTLGSSCAVVEGATLRVAVSGAGGQTGGHVFRKMFARPELFSPVGITRNEESRKALLESSGAAPEQVVVVNVGADDDDQTMAGLAAALAGCAALVIATSAKVKPTEGTNPKTGRPNMGFPDGQPYTVDWLGQRRQIDAARKAGVEHVVICSSMGGTDPNNMLNTFGRSSDGTSGGGILLWKRKSEKYLIDSGLKFTVVHPGGLLNEPGGQRELLVGVDDNLLPEGNRTIPRQDVAEVLLQSLLHQPFQNRSFDVVSRPDVGAAVDIDFKKLLDPLGSTNCDYSLGVIPDDAASEAEADALRALSIG